MLTIVTMTIMVMTTIVNERAENIETMTLL